MDISISGAQLVSVAFFTFIQILYSSSRKLYTIVIKSSLLLSITISIYLYEVYMEVSTKKTHKIRINTTTISESERSCLLNLFDLTSSHWMQCGYKQHRPYLLCCILFFCSFLFITNFVFNSFSFSFGVFLKQLTEKNKIETNKKNIIVNIYLQQCYLSQLYCICECEHNNNNNNSKKTGKNRQIMSEQQQKEHVVQKCN